VVTELDAMSGALFARNAYSSEFGERTAFVDSSGTTRTVTADRTEFLGRNGTPADWSSFPIHYRYRETHYHITVHNRGGGSTVERVVVDGIEQAELSVSLIDDRNDHQVEVLVVQR
ncbi:MAG: hypothetical protein B7Z74_02780, partial [Deltaproteobacteria bacterium 21-66-5]